MKIESLSYQFVKSVPSKMDSGVLYISLDFVTMIHLCACGCGREVVTPLSPKDWNFTFNGQSISVNPSIGSWSLPCRSHYVIREGMIKWAGGWSDEQVMLGRNNDLARKRGIKVSDATLQNTRPIDLEMKVENQGVLRKVIGWFKKVLF